MEAYQHDLLASESLRDEAAGGEGAKSRQRAEPPPTPADRERAYKAGRLASLTGKSKDENPHRLPPDERTNTSDWLRAAWDAGFDHEVC